jgi:hypothetical protein
MFFAPPFAYNQSVTHIFLQSAFFTLDDFLLIMRCLHFDYRVA